MEERKRESSRTYMGTWRNRATQLKGLKKIKTLKSTESKENKETIENERDKNLPKDKNGKVAHHQGLELVTPLHHPLLLLQTLAESLKNIILGHTI